MEIEAQGATIAEQKLRRLVFCLSTSASKYSKILSMIGMNTQYFQCLVVMRNPGVIFHPHALNPRTMTNPYQDQIIWKRPFSIANVLRAIYLARQPMHSLLAPLV
jgi:hypothetical protein